MNIWPITIGIAFVVLAAIGRALSIYRLRHKPAISTALNQEIPAEGSAAILWGGQPGEIGPSHGGHCDTGGGHHA